VSVPDFRFISFAASEPEIAGIHPASASNHTQARNGQRWLDGVFMDVIFMRSEGLGIVSPWGIEGFQIMGNRHLVRRRGGMARLMPSGLMSGFHRSPPHVPATFLRLGWGLPDRWRTLGGGVKSS
jgi:hypothetical protein